MNPKSYPTILFLVCFATLAGCYHAPTTTEREASFTPYEDLKVHDEWMGRPVSIGGYIYSRSGFLVHLSGQEAHAGHAAAIDRRGYYLTAAHCVPDDDVTLYVTYRRPQADPTADGVVSVATKAQVVWRGDVAKGGPDLALLFVSRPPPAVFEWEAEPKKGDRLFAIGPNYDKKINLFDHKLGGIAGELFQLDAKSDSTPSWTLIINGVPLHKGDSGGPLVNSNGRLLGINYAMYPRIWATLKPPGIWRTQYGLAARSDLVWLRRIIDEDYAKRPDAPAITAFWQRSDSAVFLAGTLIEKLRELETVRLANGAPDDKRAAYNRQEIVRKILTDHAGLADPFFIPVVAALPRIDPSAPTPTADFEKFAAVFRDQFQMN